MDILKFSNAGGFTTKTRYADMLAGNTVWNPYSVTGSYDSLASVTVGATAQSSITFSNIPSTYTHLQIRGVARNTSNSGGGAEQNLRMQINGDTASNYSSHWVVGTGSSKSTSSENTTSILLAYGIIPMSNEQSNVYGAIVTDILDYGNINIYKTVRSLTGKATSSQGYMFLSSGGWRSTSAITSITLYPQAGSFIQYSSFGLYGIKG